VTGLNDRPGALAGATGPDRKVLSDQDDTAAPARRQAVLIARRLGIAPQLARVLARIAFGRGAE